MKKKLALQNLEVKSFITNNEQLAIRGGEDDTYPAVCEEPTFPEGCDQETYTCTANHNGDCDNTFFQSCSCHPCKDLH
ncbi:MAG: pinensin family lanthipeptide [Cyclobacteriaceae bacterium]